jgi:hypothetical protein
MMSDEHFTIGVSAGLQPGLSGGGIERPRIKNDPGLGTDAGKVRRRCRTLFLYDDGGGTVEGGLLRTVTPPTTLGL